MAVLLLHFWNTSTFSDGSSLELVFSNRGHHTTSGGFVTQRSGMPAPGWYPDPAGGAGRAYWDGHRWTSPSQQPSADKRKFVIGGIAGLVLLLILLGNCGGNDDNRSTSATSTETVTVTRTPAPSTVTVTETVSAQPPPPALVPQEPEPSLDTTTPYAPPPIVPLVPQAPVGAYYANCAAARAAGAAPLYAGEPGYRSGLDRDGDGVACE